MSTCDKNYIYVKGDPVCTGMVFINGTIGEYDFPVEGSATISSGNSFPNTTTLTLHYHNISETVFLYVPSASGWIDISNADGIGTSASGSAVWGVITGTLSDQTDLQAALDLKSDITHNHSGVYAEVSHTHIATDITDIGEMATIDDAAADGFKYGRKNSSWEKIEESGAIWGDVIGTLSNQTDLQIELNNKADYIHNHTLSNITDAGSLAQYDDAPSDSYFYARKNNTWQIIEGSGTNWGAITGTLSSQSDLQSALDNKSDITHLHSGIYAEVLHTHTLANITDAGDMAAADDVENNDISYVRKNKAWVESSGTAEWGLITGDISNQGDLYAELNNKAASGHTHVNTDITDLGEMAVVDDAPSDNSFYTRKDNSWVETNPSGAIWGQIEGVISNQTDLQAIFDTKAESGHTHVLTNITDVGSMASVDDAPSDGNQYVRKNNNWQQVTITGGGGSSVVWSEVSGDFTAMIGSGYFVDTQNGEVTVTVPSGVTIGSTFYIIDGNSNFATNNCLIDNGDSKILGESKKYIISNDDSMTTVVYKDSAFGWNPSIKTSLGEFAPIFQGKNYGYTSGGYTGAYLNVVDKFAFYSDGNATDVGDLTASRYSNAGQSSSAYGYTSGGRTGTYSNVVDKFDFSSDGNATDVGDLTVSRWGSAGQSSSSYGYTAGGDVGGVSNIVDKFSFSSDENAADVGDLTISRYGPAGQSSSSYGYTAGGAVGGASNIVDKFSFSSDENAADVGDLTISRYGPAGQSSSSYGYTAGGDVGGVSNIVDKFSFSSDENAADVGDLTVARRECAGQSSLVYGYTSGGYAGSYSNIIDKFSFSSDENASDVGDLTAARYGGAGQQY